MRISISTLATSIIAAVALTAPSPAQASSISDVEISPRANQATRAIAAQNPKAAAAAASLCGAGAKLTHAERLPDSRRFGTLYTYVIPTSINTISTCALFDNNLGKSTYMKLKLCSNHDGKCVVDEGTFSEYAGPVRIKNGDPCDRAYAIMKSNGVAIIDRNWAVVSCD